jgi:hypothetical protein
LKANQGSVKIRHKEATMSVLSAFALFTKLA